MYDNKIRISKDVLDKAQIIADEWGLKSSRVALEAVFRKYADEYLYGRLRGQSGPISPPAIAAVGAAAGAAAGGGMPARSPEPPPCEAIDALDDLLAM